jgi:transcription elongation factor Elf1
MGTLQYRKIDQGTEFEYKIACDCGNIFRIDLRTECKNCGAHYEVELNQIAPPIASNG